MRRASLLKNESGIRDLGWNKFGSGIWDPGWEKFGFRINILDKYCGSAKLEIFSPIFART
jgi:hypothetical protein